MLEVVPLIKDPEKKDTHVNENFFIYRECHRRSEWSELTQSWNLWFFFFSGSHSKFVIKKSSNDEDFTKTASIVSLYSY